MLHVLVFTIAALAVMVAVQVLADRARLPAAVLLTVTGVVYSLLPGPNVELDPEVVLTLVLPPLLYSAALHSSLSAIRENLRSVVSLSVALVLATSLLVGVAVHALVPEVGFAAAVALGAAASPPDPVAALAIGRRAGLPARLITLIEGEGLLNDATALTTFTVAVTAATSGSFSMGDASLRFVVAAAGGLAVGLFVALVVRRVRPLLHDPVLDSSVSLAVPFAAYLLGEELHVSGVLAVVVTGLVVGHDSPRFTSGASRLQATAVWRLVDFLLEGFVFLLIGQQVPTVVEGLDAYSTSEVVRAAVGTLAVVLLLRPAWLVLTQLLPRALHAQLGGGPSDGRRLSGGEVVVMSWAGTRGVISLAAIFTLPLALDDGSPMHERDLLLFCTYLVVLVTLVGQGLSFTALVHAVGLRPDAADLAQLRNQARVASVEAGLARLERVAAEEELAPEAVESIRASLSARLARYRKRLQVLESAEDGELPVSDSYVAALRTRRAVLDAQREELLRWRDAGRLPDASLRVLERELDHEEHTLPRRPSS
ncbi:CPA1 family monovalent cation:H+ antiporter [Motilibacter peucedani]|uniref:CPA1 family monovalent cation:H+ antiporter n=1 Tax=Motilibacter peucedani TaxID=598650 RepID=A0A420XN83_9ACTN|nr:Na+/H+ antiporter [Motilibacter peucedani]RKS72725.1 CPA1 family monovalent cation:H+ antiporter [Motilibacter peucedani]